MKMPEREARASASTSREARQAAPFSPEALALFLTPERIEQGLDTKTGKESRESLVRALSSAHPSDIAELVQALDADDRLRFLEIFGAQLGGEFLTFLDDPVQDSLIEGLSAYHFSQILKGLDSDDAIALLEKIPEESRRDVLDTLQGRQKIIIEQGLAWPKDSAGRMMTRDIVTIAEFWSVGQTIDYMRASRENLPHFFHDIFLVDPAFRLVGIVEASKLLRTPRSIKMNAIASVPFAISAVTNQEELAHMFRKYGWTEAPIIDNESRLVGAVTVDDIIHVLDEAHADDFLGLSGLYEDDAYRDILATTRTRFSWLFLNLLTAILASLAIALFENSLEQIVALAILMPIAASMGGNAGTQTLAITVRTLALHHTLSPRSRRRLIGKEFLVGIANGSLFAVLSGGIAGVWFQEISLALIVSAAMFANLVAAGLAGVLVPIGLARIGADPAAGSSVIVTTLTDLVGFCCFLGLATLFLI